MARTIRPKLLRLHIAAEARGTATRAGYRTRLHLQETNIHPLSTIVQGVICREPPHHRVETHSAQAELRRAAQAEIKIAGRDLKGIRKVPAIKVEVGLH